MRWGQDKKRWHIVKIIAYTDDMTGEDGAEPVQFALDGAAYEIDVTPGNYEKWRLGLALFIAHARTRTARAAAGPQRRPARNRERSAQVRAWAREQGYEVGDGGRIPVLVQRRYDEAHKGLA
jgi:hypothetical protein